MGSSFQFIGPSYQSLSPNAAADQLINLYPEQIESGTGKAPWVYYNTPGLVNFSLLPTSPVRCLWAGEGRLFAIAGAVLYEVFANATFTARGNVGNDGKPAQIFANGTQIFIVSAGRGYCDNGAGPVLITQPTGVGIVSTEVDGVGAGFTVTLISGSLFSGSLIGGTIVINSVNYTVTGYGSPTFITVTPDPGVQSNVPYSAATPFMAQSGSYLDGFFVASTPNSKQLQTSQPFDGTTWSGLDYGIKEGYPDNIQALLADHEELWVFGTSATTEIWQDTGNPQGIPFSRQTGMVLPVACIAQFTPVQLNGGVAWLGGDSRGWTVAYLALNFQPARVSNFAMEETWNSYSTVSDAVSYSYVEDGHAFWVINFPTANATWVYDASESMWHRRGWWNGTTLDRQRQWVHTFVFGKHFVGDWSTGQIYQQSLTTYTDSGTSIQRLRAAPHFSQQNAWLYFSRFWLDMQVDSADTRVMLLDWSDDGGTTYGVVYTMDVSPSANISLRRVLKRRLGRSRDRVFRIRTLDALKQAWIGAYVKFTEGSS